MPSTHLFPLTDLLTRYRRQDLNDDLLAGFITAVVLVPQGIAYAILAGLPPETGLYAGILPPIVYAIFGTSSTLSVGPASIAAIMIASALNATEISSLNHPIQSMLVLAAESGLMMLAMASLRMGRLVDFISHPVLNGFTIGASLLIIASQLPPALGLATPSCTIDLVCWADYLERIHPYTAAVSLSCLLLLLFFGKPLSTLLKSWGLAPTAVTVISRCGPLLAIALSAFVVGHFDWHENFQVAVVGKVPSGLPTLSMDFLDFERWQRLLPYSAFIALIAYVESVAIAKATARIKGEKIIPNRELVALGSANLAASISGGMPVAGGFSRTMVNYAAGARSQIAMLVAAVILAIAVAFCSSWFQDIPKAALATMILVAIFPLLRFKSMIKTWQYDVGDGIAETMTLMGVLLLGIEKGIALGIVLTLASYFNKTSHPHIAVVGRIPGSDYFRNVKRHQVQTWPHLLLLRIDESLTFANVNYIDDFIAGELSGKPKIRHVVLIFNSVNDIDATALDMLETLNSTLQQRQIVLNIAEAKGPVMDKLEKTDFVKQLQPGKVYFSIQNAVNELM